MSFQVFECEQPMECGETCVRLYGHRDNHECANPHIKRIGRQFLAERTPGEVQSIEQKETRT